MGSANVQGFDELIGKLERLGTISNRIANKALREAAADVVAVQKQVAPKGKDPKKARGATELKVGKIKTSAHKNKYIKIGITEDSKWEVVKGIYFQHYGYLNKRTGKYHAATLWQDKAWSMSLNRAEATLKSAVERELRKIL